MLDPGKVKHTLLRTNPKTDLSLTLFYNINYAIASPFLVLSLSLSTKMSMNAKADITSDP